MQKVKVAVIGASGYTGQELLRFLLPHPAVEIVCATSRQMEHQSIGDSFPRLAKLPGSELRFTNPSPREIAETGAQVAFLALPHGVAAGYAGELLKLDLRIIDLSADFRLRSAAVYEEFYGEGHPALDLLPQAVYGLPEWREEQIKNAQLLACPGCYPTSILLPLIPLLKDALVSTQHIVVNSSSGVSGAGRKADISLLFCECNESVRAYGVPKHRHLSEIEQELSWAAGSEVVISFTPHLVPVNSGICTTISVPVKEGIDIEEIGKSLQRAYQNAAFVRLLGKNKCADTKNVTRTNFIDIGWSYDPRSKRVLLFSAEDNIVKGAGGQAIQNFNIMFGFEQNLGLLSV